MNYDIFHKKNGFTLTEMLIVLAIIAIIAGMIFILVDPPRRFASMRNSEREIHLNLILNAVLGNIADNRGTFSCASGDLPTSTAVYMSSSGYHIAPCIVPDYVRSLPFEPLATTSYYYASTTDYHTGYTILRNASTGAVTASAPSAELGETISITR